MRAFPSFGKMKVFLFILFVIWGSAVATGCRSRKEVAIATTERHTDSVASLRSIGARELTRETETTTIVMRPDTLGRLVEVARDVTRSVTRETETAKQADTAVFHSDTMQNTIQETKTQETRQDTERANATAFVAGMWVTFTILVAGLAAILYMKWKLKI